MSRSKTKRRKVWVRDFGGILGHYAHEEKRNCESPCVCLVEVRPGDVLLSREDAEELRAIIVRAHPYAANPDRPRALALLRGRR